MKRLLFILLIFLVGCSGIELSSECSRYADKKQISNLAGIHINHPISVLESENDCLGQYSIDDTTFNLYYWKYSSDHSFYTNFNHSLIHTYNCKGKLCDQLYDFHYLGPPRELEVTCRNGIIWMNDEGNEVEKEIDCNVLKNITKSNQKTWPCDYNDIMDVNCK
jgi:hypothetical protein